MTLQALREASPRMSSSNSNSNMWDLDDDKEWAEVDAYRIAETFKASYKLPAQHTAGALSSFGTAVKSAVTSSIWSPSSSSSPAKKAIEDQVRETERLNEQIDELENTWFCNPEGDLSDEVMKSVVVAGANNLFFPARDPDSPRAMHVLDLKAYFSPENPLLRHARPRLCDAVATVLSHTSRECIEAFLNPCVDEFTYRREIDGSKGGLILIIRRKGNEVVCGAYRNFGFMLQWKLYVRSLIGFTGLWYEVFANTRTAMMDVNDGVPDWKCVKIDVPKVEDELEASLLSDRSPRKLTLGLSSENKFEVADIASETSPKFMAYQSRIMARYLMWDIWYLFDNLVECRATWEAAGRATVVRLQRARVPSRDET